MEKAEKRSKKYLAFILAQVFVMLAATVTLNYCVDPYGIYRDWKKDAAFPASDTYVRVHKTERIKRLRPDALVLGTSRADVGVNPKPEFWGELHPYNAALSAANVYEQRMMLEFAHRVHPLKRVVLTLDLFTFNTRRLENRHFEEQRVAPDALDPLNSFVNTYGTLVTFDTLLVAKKHLKQIRSLERQSYPRPNGHKRHDEAKWRAEKNGVQSVFWKSPNSLVLGAKEFSYNYSDKPGDDTLHQFRAMLDFCEREKIDVYLYFGPLHQAHLDQMKQEGRWKLFESWKKEIAEIVSRTKYPLWDFADYNSFTTEKIPPESDKVTQMKYFWDTDHYKEFTGDVIQRKIFGLAGKDEYPDFGKRIH